MPDIVCIYAKKQTAYAVKCAKLGGACGFTTSVDPAICVQCIASKSNVAKLSAKGTPELWRLYKGLLFARLTAAFVPGAQQANPIDVDLVYSRLQPLLAPDEDKALLARILELHTGTEAGAIVEFAERYNLTSALEEVTGG